jgi:hypothetical protein
MGIAMSDPRDPRILGLAQEAVARLGNITKVASAIDFSRPYLSRYLNNDLDGVEEIEKRLIDHYDRRVCPHTEVEITPDECRSRALSPKPFGGNARLAYWTRCQSCPHQPEHKQFKEAV